MSHTLYATFADPQSAERAAGALLSHGVRAEDLSVVRQAGEGYSPITQPSVRATNVANVGGAETYVALDPADVTADREDRANRDEDIQPDAPEYEETKAAAIKGAEIGAGIGLLAALAALVVPGLGIVLGAGALASALGGVAATAGAGAAAGAIVGYLKENGIDDDAADDYQEVVASGGAILAITVPSGTVEEDAANAVLKEHGATNVNRYAARAYAA